jgi:hypothetical protein
MKIKKTQLKKIIREGIKVVLKERKKTKLVESKMSAEQVKFAKPIFDAAAKKGGFKIKNLLMLSQPNAEIVVYKYGKDSGSMWNIWGTTFTKSEAMQIKKIIEKTDSDMISGEPSYRPKVKVGTDTEYMELWVAAQFAGIKYDNKEYDRLFRGN